MTLPRKHEVIEDVRIRDIALKGKGLGRVDNTVVFVPEVVPGDVVNVRITKKKSNYLEGKPVSYLKYSKHRTEPFCSHFDKCGGCKWQHLDYPGQLKYKQNMVYEALHRLARVDGFEMNEIIPATHTRYYRNRLDFAFSDNRWLTHEEIKTGKEVDKNAAGLHIPGRFDKILDLSHCYLQEYPSNEIRQALKDFAQKQGLSFFDIKGKKGLLRSLIVRTSLTGEVMVIVIFGEKAPGPVESVMKFLKNRFPGITSLYYVINTKSNDTFYDLATHLYSGRPCIREKLGNGMTIELGPKSFYQTNSYQAPVLYKKAAEMAAIRQDEIVYDLYSGVGSISLYVAEKARLVAGIENIPEAVQLAQKNARNNQVKNVDFLTGETETLLKQKLTENDPGPDVVITDPPRAGMHPKAVKALKKLAPGRIVYVSCNPATQARDIGELIDSYDVLRSQPVDMFPHTYHIENVLLMKKRQMQ